MKPTKPPRLREGDRVALVAPAGPVSASSLKRAKAALESLGLQVDVFGSPTERYFCLAGPDEARLEALQEAFLEPAIRAVVGLRGGYGSMRLLPLLDFELIRAHPTIFLGSSDLTALLTALVQRAGLVAFHSPTAASSFFLEPEPSALERFWRLLGQDRPFGPLRPSGLRVLRPGKARGRLMGGCLSLLAATCGTAWQIDARGAILFIEDVSEAAYRIDRMLTQLLLSGALEGVRAVVVGEMVRCSVPRGATWSLDELLLERLGHLGVPVVAGFPAGHGPTEAILPMGVEAELDTEEGTLTICEPAVS